LKDWSCVNLMLFLDYDYNPLICNDLKRLNMTIKHLLMRKCYVCLRKTTTSESDAFTGPSGKNRPTVGLSGREAT
jgi:hypothetical protein